MNFLKDIFGWIFSRFAALAFFVVLLLGVSILLDFGREHATDFEQIKSNLEETRRTVSRKLTKLQTYEERRAALRRELDATPWYRHPIRRAELKTEIAACEHLRDTAQAALKRANATKDQLAAELRSAGNTFLEKIRRKWRESGWRCTVYLAALLFLTPLLWKIFMYFLVARLVELLPPLKLTVPDEPPPRKITTGTAIDYLLAPGETLLVRSRGGDWAKKRTGVTAKSRLIWNPRYPLVSFAADLCELAAYSGDGGKTPPRVTITSPLPDLFLAQIHLAKNSELIVRPRHLAALSDSISIRTHWSFTPMSLISGRFRQIILRGEGTVFLAGCWGIEETRATGTRDIRVEDNLLLGYSAGAAWSLCRTQTFWHYLRGHATLFDRRLEEGAFYTQNNAGISPVSPSEGGFEKCVNAFLNVLGGLLGF